MYILQYSFNLIVLNFSLNSVELFDGSLTEKQHSHSITNNHIIMAFNKPYIDPHYLPIGKAIVDIQ